MARIDRTGNRKTRDQRKKLRTQELGYYLIVTDTEGTERCYFEGLRKCLPDSVKDRLVIKVIETKTAKLIDKCLEYTGKEAQYRMPWIVFDRDQVPDYDSIISRAEKLGIGVGWSNPCFEIWMFAYYGKMPVIQESWKCCEKFADLYYKKTGQQYDKADEDLYRRIADTGDELKAITVAERKFKQCIGNGYRVPSEMCPCTTVHRLIGEIRGKC